MAIQKDFELSSGILVNDAYWQIINFQYAKGFDETKISVLVYASKAAKEAGKSALNGVVTFTVENTLTNEFLSEEAIAASGNGYIKQAYLYLLSLPQFQSAESV